MAAALPLVPEITDADVEWACNLMRLDAPDAARLAFLTASATVDVSACPGSGKTTLVVAKLAILARKWPYRTKGICVLSHTNVAREEIQRRLGRSVVGQRLLGYPHFIDTIHGFVNRFLALPWLNSNGYPPPTIDDAVTTAYRRGVLAAPEYRKVQRYLEGKFSGFDRLRICDRDLHFDLEGKAFPAGPHTDSFKFAKHAIESAARAGYFCYDEMFVWARSLLDDFPDVAAWLRRRFPLVLLDEMQDTTELQGGMLNAVFPRQSPETVVQRVGDPNQAIFDKFDAKRDEGDPFPDADPSRNLGIPNSYRFGPEIAALASPFAITHVGADGLCGIGPRLTTGAPAACRHAIFIFPDDTTAGVLDSYGKHVLATFDDDALARGAVAAVGAVHQDAPDVAPGHSHFPKSVPHYWSGYTAEFARKEPHPKSLVQYVRAAQAVVRNSCDLSPGVEKLASGLIRVAGCIGNAGHMRRMARKHRTVLHTLKADAAALEAYRLLLKTLLIDWMPLTEENWRGLQNGILAVARALCDGDTEPRRATNFLEWARHDPSLAVSVPMSPTGTEPNVYRVSDGDRCVDIRLGSIHSVKGQTHLATLVLSTYWHDHSSKRIMPWLLGDKVNGDGANGQDCKRLLQTYVAMTRPSHMICLAVPRHVLGNVEALARHIATLSGRGWRVAEIMEGSLVWRA